MEFFENNIDGVMGLRKYNYDIGQIEEDMEVIDIDRSGFKPMFFMQVFKVRKN